MQQPQVKLYIIVQPGGARVLTEGQLDNVHIVQLGLWPCLAVPEEAPPCMWKTHKASW